MGVDQPCKWSYYAVPFLNVIEWLVDYLTEPANRREITNWTTIVFENRVKKLLANSQAAWGASLPDASDMLTKFTVDSGVDFLWVDLEHRSFEVDAVKWVPIICRRKGCACMIRVAGLDSQLIKKARTDRQGIEILSP